MTAIEHQDRFNELSQAAGNRYVALQDLIVQAKKHCNSVNNRILPSEGITWALTDIVPQRVKDGSVFKEHISIQDQLLNDTLSEIDKLEIRQSVLDSYNLSITSPHLVYAYHDALNEYEQGRVRIIMKMLWSKIKEEENK